MTTIDSSTDIVSIEEKYHRAFSIAETHLKSAEYFIQIGTIEGEILIPAINELRYAGYHAACAIAPSLSEAEKIEAYNKAIAHCERANYDSLDALFCYHIKECKIFKDDYKLVVVSNVIPNYIDQSRCIENIIKECKQQKDKKSRFQCIEKHISIIADISEQWSNSREELNKILRKTKKELLNMLLNKISLIVAIITFIILLINFFC
ncbi:MAG: hypothetical protein LBC02_08610 [Planctomycetaceae bacterium]|jgi:preprotein translocase subunit SecE|nr:hypothetical protein [Planctomycetaceae bacterium]